MESPVLSTAQTAAYINRSEDFVRKQLKYEISYVQHGPSGPLYFFRSDLDRWLAAHTQVPAQ